MKNQAAEFDGLKFMRNMVGLAIFKHVDDIHAIIAKALNAEFRDASMRSRFITEHGRELTGATCHLVVVRFIKPIALGEFTEAMKDRVAGNTWRRIIGDISAQVDEAGLGFSANDVKDAKAAK